MKAPVNFKCYPVDTTRWSDLERLFESRGSPHYCWCMLWRKVKAARNRTVKSGKKTSLKRFVEDRIPVGLLGYVDDEPVAWCSVAPRESFRPMGGDENKKNVWSLVCFFIKRPFRNHGLTSQLINAAIGYAQNNGAQYLEAYPVAADSPSYRFMGLVPVFKKANFKFVKKAGTRRQAMMLRLDTGIDR